jgi:hypothetical protein
MLARGSAAAAETAPAQPPPAQTGKDPMAGAPVPADAGAPPAANMVYVEPSVTWEDQPREPADLMDLGADAQAQGTAMALTSVANRLAGVIQDLGTLEYFERATGLIATMEWAVEEHNRIMGELEQRGRERRGEE